MKNGMFAPFSIFSKLLKCKNYFLENIQKFELFIEMLLYAKYSIWGKGLSNIFTCSYECTLFLIELSLLKQLLISSRSSGVTSIHCVDEQIVCILIGWFHQKPADLDLHCFQIEAIAF